MFTRQINLDIWTVRKTFLFLLFLRSFMKQITATIPQQRNRGRHLSYTSRILNPPNLFFGKCREGFSFNSTYFQPYKGERGKLVWHSNISVWQCSLLFVPYNFPLGKIFNLEVNNKGFFTEVIITSLLVDEEPAGNNFRQRLFYRSKDNLYK